MRAQRVPGAGAAVAAQGGDGVQPGDGLGAVASGLQKPALEGAAAHAGHAGVKEREQGGVFLAAQGLHQLEVAAGGHGQGDQRIAVLHPQLLHVRQRAPLRVLGVGQQRGGGGMGVGQVRRIPGAQARGAQLFQQLALAERAVELPFGTLAQSEVARGCLQRFQALLESGRDVGAVDQLAGRYAGQPVVEFVGRALHQVQLALGHAQPSQATGAARGLVHGQQDGFGLVRQQFAVGQCAGRHHPHHLAFHRALAGGHIADLLADRHRFAVLDQAREVAFHRMKGHAGHDHRLAGRLAAPCQRDVEQARGLFGIGEEQLIEIAHAVEHERLGVFRLDGQVLGHHGGVGAQVERGCHGARQNGALSSLAASVGSAASGPSSSRSSPTPSPSASAAGGALAWRTAALSPALANLLYLPRMPTN